MTRYDFFLSPGWQDRLAPSTIRGILRQLQALRTRRFVWNVRWDHLELAEALAKFALEFRRVSTHVVPLDGGHERVFARYNATMRNQVRASERKRVLVRATSDAVDLEAYHRVYLEHGRQKGWTELYPFDLLRALVAMPDVARFFVASFEDSVIGGGLFLRDGESVVYYMQGVYDRAYAQLFPSCPVIDAGIRWACESGARFCNLGMSGGIASLERFKSFWGASQLQNWSFQWDNPYWTLLSRMKDGIGRGIGVIHRNEVRA